MSPESTQVMRRVTGALAVVWAIAALGLAIYGQFTRERHLDPPIHTTALGRHVVVSSLGPAAEAAGIALGDRVRTVDGVPIRRWYRERGWEQTRAGQMLHYEIESRNGRVITADLTPVLGRSAYDRFLIPIFAALVLVGATFLFIGVLVWRLKPDRAESWAFLLFSSTMATALFGAVHTYDAAFGYERMAMTLPLLGAATLHLFTIFPHEPSWVARHRRVRQIPYVIAAAIACGVVLERAAGVSLGMLLGSGFVIAIGAGLVGTAVLVSERIRMRGSEETASADLVLSGVILSLLPVLGLFLVQLVSPITLPMAFALVWFVVFPLSVGYGIVRGRLFEVRNLARSSAAYGAATLAITGLFASLITFADVLFRRFNVNADSPYFSVAFLFFAILAFNPLRDRLQSLVDRLFDRNRAGFRSAVREISEAMVSMLSLSEIGERLLMAVTDTMGVERAMVLLLDEESRALTVTAWRGDWDEEARSYTIPVDHPAGKHLWMRRRELARADFLETSDAETREACWDVFDTLDVRLLVPILFGVDLLGVIAVGAKLSGERLGPDERQLLRTLANQSAIAIENAQAFDEIAKLNETLEARVEARTRELQDTQTQLMQSEKMRHLGQLVAGVAHDLNNPIGVVHANLQLLDGYFEKLVRAQEAEADPAKPRMAIDKLLARSLQGTKLVKDIVMNLRSFSRMDQAELSDTDLNEELSRTLGLLEPRFSDGIRVETDFAPLPSVRCYPAQLNQVFMNLVMNACDSMVDGGGTIRVITRPSEAGVTLSFEDEGSGIPEDVRARIFEPFFTTKEVGQGTGLGLSISHGIVLRHGGRLEVADRPGGGTRFDVQLPLVAAPPEVAPD